MGRMSPADQKFALAWRPTEHDRLAPRVAMSITITVICGFFAVTVTYVAGARHGVVGFGVCSVLMLALMALQFCHSFPSSVPRLARYRKHTLTTQVLLTYGPFLLFGAAWLGMPGFLAASSLLILKAKLAWATFVTVVVSAGALQSTLGNGMADLAYSMVATALTGLVVFGLSRLTELVREVQAARTELAQLAVAQERLRFARDLHDLLGYSLSTITLKCELTHRLVRPAPDRAETEIREILQTARQALADVRSVASSYLRMSLNQEVRAAEKLLHTVGIKTEVRQTPALVSGAAETALATVLREGITNMLRHSQAQRCVIETRIGPDTVRLLLANDGVGADEARVPSGAADEGGNGLRNLTARAEALGGTLRAGEREDGWFELMAEVPVDATEGADGTALTASRNPAPPLPHPSGSGR